MTSLEKLKKLDIQTALLFEKLESETGNKLNYSKNKWSILQILYHVWLAEISSEKYIRTKTKYPGTIVKTPILAYVKAFLTKYFLKFGFTINAPKVTTEFPEKICLKELKSNWKSSRLSFSKLIIDLDQKNLSNKAIFKHALMGRINMSLTLYFFELHFNHHQKQIDKILACKII
jgi:hypothetical protein